MACAQVDADLNDHVGIFFKRLLKFSVIHKSSNVD